MPSQALSRAASERLLLVESRSTQLLPAEEANGDDRRDGDPPDHHPETPQIVDRSTEDDVAKHRVDWREREKPGDRLEPRGEDRQ
jgi:hypothetical protein